MKLENETRPYRMQERARKVARNEARILAAVAGLWKELPIGEITLEKVAERSGVTVRTLLRKYGSKDGLFEASIDNDAADMMQDRERAVPGDLDSILDHLLREYEQVGDAVLRTLAVEQEIPAAARLAKEGRRFHKNWCARVFAPYLPDATAPDHSMQLMAFVATTDLYLWKLFRRDHGLSAPASREVFRNLLQTLIDQAKKQ